jgi:hypothetical protein
LGDTRHTAQLLGGAVDLPALGEDGFRLKTCAGHLLVIAGPVRGTLYGVYDLLERFGGCRWFSVNVVGCVIPDPHERTLPLVQPSPPLHIVLPGIQ